MIAFPTLRGPLATKFGTVFDSDYQAVLTQATSLGYTLPDTATQVAGNQFVLALKAAGIWTKLDALWMYATTGSSDFASLNWKNPALYQHTIVNTVNFRSKGGFTPVGTSYISTNWNPATNGVQYTQDNASRAVYLTTQSLPAPTAAASIDGNTTTAVNSIRNTASVTNRINSTAGLSLNYDYQGSGLKIINRTDANTVVLSSGTTTGTSTPNTSTAISSSVQLVGRSGGGYLTAEVGMYAVGSELTTVTSQFVSAINTYIRSMNTGFDTDYQAIINRANTLGYALPSAYCQAVQNDMVIKLKAAGLWSKLDIFYHFENDASTSDFATLNWKAPSSFQITLVNSPVWLSAQGINLTTAGQYFDTNFIPSSHAVTYLQDSASVNVRVEGSSSGNIFGTTNGTTGYLQHISTNAVSSYLNSTNPLGTTPSSSSGHFSRGLNRSASTDVNYKGISTALAAASNLRTQTSNGIPTTSVWIGRSGTSSSIGLYKFFSLGGSLTDSEQYTLHSIIMGMYGVL